MGDKPTSCKIVKISKHIYIYENNFARYMLKQLFTSVSVNNCSIYVCICVYICIYVRITSIVKCFHF